MMSTALRLDQHLGNLQRLFAAARLADQQRLQIDAQPLRPSRIERMLGIDERCRSPPAPSRMEPGTAKAAAIFAASPWLKASTYVRTAAIGSSATKFFAGICVTLSGCDYLCGCRMCHYQTEANAERSAIQKFHLYRSPCRIGLIGLASARESGMRTTNPTMATTMTITTTFGSLKLWLATTSAAAMLR